MQSVVSEHNMLDVLRNLLQYGELTFRDFVELALYYPDFGYYSRGGSPVGKQGDYVTAPTLSPVFSFAIAGLFREFLRRTEGAVCSFVDIGCGDGSLVRAIAAQVGDPEARFFGVDRSLSRVGEPGPDDRVRFLTSLDRVPRDGAHLIFSNELYDAFPFARLVQRGEHLHELWVGERDGVLDWSEREAPAAYEHYFAERGITLVDGQFADVSLEWGAFYGEVAAFLQRGLIVTLDYGFPGAKLFHPRARRFGTAAAYSQQRVHRDLLASPGEQDLTAHINFTDLERAGEAQGLTTLFFDRMAKFLLVTNITDHELFRPLDDLAIENVEAGLQLLDARDEARRLILPDGIGEDLRVLVQGKAVAFENWSFKRNPF